MKLELRRSRPSDDAFIARLSGSAFSEYTLDARERSAGSRRAATTLVATFGDRPIGFAVLRIKGAVAHLDAIAVVEQHRGRGVGRALLESTEREAKRGGSHSVELATAEANLAALELFLKCGYRIARTMPGFYPRGQTAHLLEKRL
jgi:[ribosomal protein S18]-alanine N-acetyltransferase